MNRRSRRQIAKGLGSLSDSERQSFSTIFRLPIHVQDQVEAAEADLEKRLVAAAEKKKWGYSKAIPSPALRDRLDWIVAGMLSGELGHCEHLGASPRICFIALWQDFLHCGCGWEELTPVEEFTCDLCRVYHPNDCRPQIVQTGPLAVLFGICSECEAHI